jgi:uncharacterized membrane protein
MKSLFVALILASFITPAAHAGMQCAGAEPFWEITTKSTKEGDFLMFKAPDAEAPVALKLVAHTDAHGYAPDNMTVYKTKYSSLTVIRGECRDSLLDDEYTHYAVFQNHPRVWGGCCNVTVD